MDASLCTVVILHQNDDKPYHIIDHEQDNYLQLFKSSFGKVYIQQDPLEAIEKVKQSHNSILLVDLDAINYSDDTTSRHDFIIHLLENITRELNSLLPNYIPLVVCSNNDSASLMLGCIHAGATDYLLKPLYLNVIKTLFLKLHRCQPESKMHLLPPQQPNALCERMNEMNQKDTHLSKILMDVFVPKSQKYSGISNIQKKRSAELQSQILCWDFSPFGLSQPELIHCVYLILNQVLTLPELKHLSIEKSQLLDFIIDLANVYHDENPYHNFAHAVDVLQCLFFMLCELAVLPFTNKQRKQSNMSHKKPQDVLRPKDVFALLIAAIGHDAAHPGVNNMFLINSCNPLATLYNDRSVLESLHSMTLFQLLNQHGILQRIGDTKSDDYKEFRKTVVSSILATDMSLHLDYVTKIKEQAHRFNTKPDLLYQKDQEETERNLICSALIKCADISNVARPFRWGAKWAELLVEEFVCQGDLEKKLGMPVLPMNDRDKVILEDSQIGFIRFVALDLFQNVRDILCDISFAVDQMQANLKQWETRKNTLTVHNSGLINEDAIMIPKQDESDFDVISNTSTTSIITTGSKRSSSSLDFDSSSDTNDIKRISVEKHRKTNNYHLVSSKTSSYNQQVQFLNEEVEDEEQKSMTSTAVVPPCNNHTDETHYYQRKETVGPVYCQCSIQ